LPMTAENNVNLLTERKWAYPIRYTTCKLVPADF
jgi:hypothetical protein